MRMIVPASQGCSGKSMITHGSHLAGRPAESLLHKCHHYGYHFKLGQKRAAMQVAQMPWRTWLATRAWRAVQTCTK